MNKQGPGYIKHVSYLQCAVCEAQIIARGLNPRYALKEAGWAIVKSDKWYCPKHKPKEIAP